jgi:hypothetical protein
MQSSGLKNPLILSFGRKCASVKQWENLCGRDLHAQIYGRGWIPEPPHHSTFKARGGSGIEHASLSG